MPWLKNVQTREDPVIRALRPVSGGLSPELSTENVDNVRGPLPAGWRRTLGYGAGLRERVRRLELRVGATNGAGVAACLRAPVSNALCRPAF